VFSVPLQASPPLLYRALKLNMRAHRWERAMQLALQHAAAVASKGGAAKQPTFIDLVLWYRQRYNASLKRCVAAVDAARLPPQCRAIALSPSRLHDTICCCPWA
jgi:hypothetical protein